MCWSNQRPIAKQCLAWAINGDERITEVPTSVAEHTRIIETVAKEPATDSEQEIESALRDHLRSSNDHFGLDIGDIGGGKGSTPPAPR